MVYSAKQRAFVLSQESKLPGIAANFDAAVEVAPDARPAWAKYMLSRVFRDGWQSGGADFGWHRDISLDISETTASHVHDLKAIARRFFSGAEGLALEACLDVHDDVEAVAHIVLPTQGLMLRRDINLFRGIVMGDQASGVVPSEVKAEIETIGADILFEVDPERKALWLDYEAKGSDAAQLASSLDKVAVMIKCGQYVDLGMSPDDFRFYWRHWTLERVKEKCHPRVTELYGDVLLPEIRESIARVDPAYDIG